MKNAKEIYEKCKATAKHDLEDLNKSPETYFWELIRRCKESGISKRELNSLLKKEVHEDQMNYITKVLVIIYDKSLQAGTSSYERIEEFLQSKYDFRKNVVNDQVEFRLKGEEKFMEVKNYDLNTFHRELKIAHIPVHQTIMPTIINSGFAKKYFPFQDYFDSLLEWDQQIDYIGQLAETVKTNNDELWSRAFKKWVVTVVGSALKDEVINHTVLLLSGPQGIGKTTWMERLIPPKLKDYYYSGSIDPRNKDTLIYLTECFIINLDEISNLNRTETGELKQIITLSQIKLRRPFNRFPEVYPRRASFMGSVNNTEFLHDQTGSRRFLAFEVSDIDYKHTIDIEKVYQQARYLFDHGFQFFFDQNESREITMNNEQFQFQSMEEEVLLQYFEPAKTNEEADFFYNATQVLDELTQRDIRFQFNNGNKMNMGKILTKHEFRRIKKKGLYVYAIRERLLPMMGLNGEKVDADTTIIKNLEMRASYENYLLDLDDQKIKEKYDRLRPHVIKHYKSLLSKYYPYITSLNSFLHDFTFKTSIELDFYDRGVMWRILKDEQMVYNIHLLQVILPYVNPDKEKDPKTLPIY